MEFITLDCDEDGIWLIEESDQGPIQMGNIRWEVVAHFVKKHLDEVKEDGRDN